MATRKRHAVEKVVKRAPRRPKRKIDPNIPIPEGASDELAAVYQRLHHPAARTRWELRLEECGKCGYLTALKSLPKLRALRRDAVVLVAAFLDQASTGGPYLVAMAKNRRLASLLRQTRVRTLPQARLLVAMVDTVYEKWVGTWEAKMAAATKAMLEHHLEWTYAQTTAFLADVAALNESDIRRRRWPGRE